MAVLGFAPWWMRDIPFLLGKTTPGVDYFNEYFDLDKDSQIVGEAMWSLFESTTAALRDTQQQENPNDSFFYFTVATIENIFCKVKRFLSESSHDQMWCDILMVGQLGFIAVGKLMYLLFPNGEKKQMQSSYAMAAVPCGDGHCEMEKIPELFKDLDYPTAYLKKGETTKMFEPGQLGDLPCLSDPSNFPELEFKIPSTCDIEPVAKVFGEKLTNAIVSKIN